ncbi:hypothetical protein SNE40_023186 [Patella caerulea]
MKRKKPRQPRNPIAGVKEDLDSLIQKFSESGTVRYENFSSAWKQKKLSMIQSGRQDQQEAREFLEDVFRLAVVYYLPPNNFQVRTGGLYLMFGLFNTQFCIPPVKFRMTLQMWKDALDYQKEAHSQQHYDIDFVFHSLKALSAFQFVASESEMYLKGSNRRNIMQDIPSHVSDEVSKIDAIFTKDHVRQLSAVDYQYQQLKIALAGPNAKKPDIALAVIQDSLIDSLNSTIQQHQERITKMRKRDMGEEGRRQEQLENSDDEEEEEEEDHGSLRAKLKSRAYSAGTSKYKIPSPQKTSSAAKTETATMVPIGLMVETDHSEDENKQTEYISMPDLGTNDIDSPKGKKRKSSQKSPHSPTKKNKSPASDRSTTKHRKKKK